MEEFVYYNSLFDIYGCLLTEKERVTFKDYYQEDLSLAEIAIENKVSRTAVYKTVKTVIDKLNKYEENLHVYENNRKLNDILVLTDEKEIKDKIKEMLEK